MDEGRGQGEGEEEEGFFGAVLAGWVWLGSLKQRYYSISLVALVIGWLLPGTGRGLTIQGPWL